MVKLHTLPDNSAAGHRRSEVVVFLSDARDRFSPSMASYQATERSTGMRAGLVGRPRAKSKGYQPAGKRAKSQTFGRLVSRLDLAALYAQARNAVQAEDAELLRAVPTDCPLQLHDLLSPNTDPATLQVALGGATAKTAARHPRTNRPP